MFEECHLSTFLIVKRHHFIENSEVARLLQIGHRSEDEPAWVVVESASDVVVATLGQWLVLVIAAAVGELRRGNVDDALTGSRWYLVDEAHKVLVGVAEAHSPSYAALEEAGASREVEGHHALVLVPDVHHAIELVVARAYVIYTEQTVPVFLQLAESLVYLFRCVETIDELMGLLFIDNLWSGEFLFLFVLNIAQ